MRYIRLRLKERIAVALRAQSNWKYVVSIVCLVLVSNNRLSDHIRPTIRIKVQRTIFIHASWEFILQLFLLVSKLLAASHPLPPLSALGSFRTSAFLISKFLATTPDINDTTITGQLLPTNSFPARLRHPGLVRIC